MKKLITLLCVSLLILSCNNEEENQEPGVLNLSFTNTVADQAVDLGNTAYTNQSGEQFVIDELKYIISNISLVREDGTEFIYPIEDSYFLISEEDAASRSIALNTIDAGAYVAIKFGFGVDPMKYPIESGTLNFIPRAEEAGMLWSWSAGYKFLKFEGNYTAAGSTVSEPFLYHVGSHGATLDNYKEITLPLDTVTISSATPSNRSIQFDVGAIFDSVHTISIDFKNEIMVDPVNAPLIADNISTAFSIQ